MGWGSGPLISLELYWSTAQKGGMAGAECLTSSSWASRADGRDYLQLGRRRARGKAPVRWKPYVEARWSCTTAFGDYEKHAGSGVDFRRGLAQGEQGGRTLDDPMCTWDYRKQAGRGSQERAFRAFAKLKDVLASVARCLVCGRFMRRRKHVDRLALLVS